jgi:tyrosyl-tRNA synthetase
MPSHESLLDELAWRGLVYQQTEGLAAHFAKGPVTAYCGFDPTAASLHVGNLVPVMLLVHLARAGHRAIALVGGGTAMIGDPSGRSAERPLSSAGEIAANAARIHAQLARLFEAAGAGGVTLRNNAEWLLELRAVDFMRDVGKHFSVNYMLAKDSVQTRLESGISYTEFSYMLLQAYDYLQLSRTAGVTLQVGGSDQWGNLTAGTELVRRAGAGEAHALTAPLITTSSGRKFGKTEGGAVWLDAPLTSPYQFYQFWVNADDADVGKYLRFFTLFPRERITEIEESHAAAPHERGAQRVLADHVTALIHGREKSEQAALDTDFMFGRKSARDLPVSFLDELRNDPRVPFVQLRQGWEGLTTSALLSLVVEAEKGKEKPFLSSKSEANRLLKQGGIYLNDERLSAESHPLSDSDLLHNLYLLLRRGQRTQLLIRVLERGHRP